MALEIKKNHYSRKLSWFRTEHNFEYLAEVKTIKDIEEAIIYANNLGRDVYILGNGSNTLFSQPVINTFIIKNKLPSKIENIGDHKYTVSSATPLMAVLKYCYKNNLSSFYYLSSVPATIGGALAMNAGRGARHKLSIYDFVDSISVVENNQLKTYRREEIPISYRKTPFTGVQKNFIVSATFEFLPEIFTASPIEQRLSFTKETQETSLPNCGSVFSHCNSRILRLLKGLRLNKSWYSKITTNWIVSESKNSREIVFLIRIAVFLHKLCGKKIRQEIITVK